MKKSHLYSCLILLLLTLCLSSASAQVHVGLNAFFFNPQGDLKEAGFGEGTGVGLELSSRDYLPNFFLNFRWGVHGDYAWNGSKSLLLESDPLNFTETTLSITNQSAGGHVFGRLITKGDKMRWYMDYFLGSRYFFTTETFFIRDLTADDYEEYETQIGMSTSSTTLYRGWSVGVEYRITQRFFLDLRMTKVKGSGAAFADLETVALYGNQVQYDLKQSRDTHNLAWHIGISFRLGKGRDRSKQPSQAPQVPQQTPVPQNDGELNKPPLPKS